jgi:hypothetical protein
MGDGLKNGCREWDVLRVDIRVCEELLGLEVD